MKKLFVILALCLMPYALSAARYNAVLVADMDTGRVLYSEKANDLNYPASLTKIMTLYLVFDALEHGRLNLDDQLIVSQSAANANPIKLGLAAGSKIKVEDAIKAIAVVSANDVARVLAENLKGGREGNFASLMTEVASQIGLSRTNFENASGLPDDDHMSSARDIALLSMAIYQHFPQYQKYFGIRSWTYNGRTYNNGNRLLASYPGCNGMKTGFTNKSRYSLVSTASRGGKNVMAVVLGAENKDVRADVSRRMLDRGFTELGVGSAAPTNTVPVPAVSSSSTPVAATGGGRAGVQFGAFGSKNAADGQARNAKNITGANATTEQFNGLWRVRAYGLSESAAQTACSKFKSAGHDCFIFR
ncbi:MAG: D-alanyl-D-alanine carboxypeptidase [Alphaproteobacteria bacterium]|nr:D-alanyl-D-alanine carboxypeptidase [Alphaproteobacteria bacterium]